MLPFYPNYLPPVENFQQTNGKSNLVGQFLIFNALSLERSSWQRPLDAVRGVEYFSICLYYHTIICALRAKAEQNNGAFVH